MKLNSPLIPLAIAMSGLTIALSAGNAVANNLPASQTQGNITYLTGGISESEATAIKEVAGLYPLELEFLRKAKPRDQYLADIRVQIKDARDMTVLNATANGPFLLAKMPAGKYTVSAENNGKTERRKINLVTGGHRFVVFEWRK